MMLPEVVMAKLDGVAQTSQLSALAGKSYTVSKVTTAGNGLGSWMFLSPKGGGAAGKMVALKLEGTTQLTSLVGKSVTVGKAPTAMGAGKWLVLYPGAKTAAAGAGIAGAGVAKTAAASKMTMIKLEGARQASQMSGMTGKSFTVLKPTSAAGQGAGKWLFMKPVAGSDIIALKVKGGATSQISSLVGKTVTVGKAPMVAGGTSKWMVLHTGGAAAKAGGAMVPVGGMMKTAAFKTAATTAPAAGTAGTAMAGAATKTAAAGTIWQGTGLSLGLGLGLGAWGPAILGGALAAAGYGVYRYRKGQGISDDELSDALDEGH